MSGLRISDWLKNNGGSNYNGASTSTYRKKKNEENEGLSFSDWFAANPTEADDYARRQQPYRQQYQADASRRREERQQQRQERQQNRFGTKNANYNMLNPRSRDIHVVARQRSEAIEELQKWSRSVGVADVNSTHALSDQADELEKFFSSNKSLYNNKTLNEAQNILKNGRAILKKKDPSIGMNQQQLARYATELQTRQTIARDRKWNGSMLENASQESLSQEEDAKKRLDALKAQNAELKRQKKLREYSALMKNTDFATNSQYQSTVQEREQTAGDQLRKWMPGQSFQDTSFDLDEEYETVNRNRKYIDVIDQSRKETEAQLNYGIFDENGPVHVEYEMTDEERSIYNYLYNTKGKQTAHAYLEELRPELNKRSASEISKMTKELTDEPGGAAVMSLLSILDKPIVGMKALAAQLGTAALGKEIDPYDPVYAYSRMNSEVRANVGQNLADAVGGGVKGELANRGYQTVMSLLDNLYGVALGGGFSTGGSEVLKKEAETFVLSTMGTDSASSHMNQLLESGAPQERAVILGLAAGAAEIITEKIGLDNLFSVPWKGRAALKSLGSQVLAEGAEEGLSDILNWTMDDIYDVITSQDQSEWKQKIKQIMVETGMNESQAMGQAFGDRMKELGLDIAGGALSGGLMGSGAAIANNVNLAEQGKEYKQELSADDPLQNMSDLQVGREVARNMEYTEEDYEEEAPRLLEQAAQEVAKKGEVSDMTAVQILPNEPAVTELEFQTGLEIETEADVKQAVLMIANGTTVSTPAQNAQAEQNEEIPTQTETSIPLETRAVYDEATARTSVPANTETTPQTDGVLRPVRQNVPTNVNPQLLETEKSEAKMDADFANVHALAENYESRGMSAVGVEIENNYDDNFNAVTYNKAVTEIVEAAVTGKEMPNTVLPVAMADTIYKTAQTEGRVRYGGTADSVSGNSGRFSGESAKGQGEVLDGSTRETSQGRGDDGSHGLASEDSETVGEEVTAKSLGLENGTNEGKVRVMSGGFSSGMQAYSDIEESHGNRVHYYKGGSLTFATGATKGTVVAYKDGKHDIYIKADHPAFTPEQIGGHESYHIDVDEEVARTGKKRSAIINRRYNEFARRIGKGFCDEKIFEVYKKMYAGQDMKDWQIKEELLADFAGGMNEMEQHAPFLTDTWVGDSLRRIYSEEGKAFRDKSFRTGSGEESAGASESGQVFQSRELSEPEMRNVRNLVRNQQIITPQAEIQFSRERNTPFMDKAYKKNEKTKLVPINVLNHAARMREITKDWLERYKEYLPEDKMGKDWVTKNGSYGLSGDLGTVCIRSLAAEPLMDLIAEKIGHPLTAEETTFISQEIMNYTHMPECIYCYVAMDRHAKRQYLNDYINWREQTIKDIQNGLSDDEVKKNYLSFNYKSGARVMNPTLQKRLDAWRDMALNGAEKISKNDLASNRNMDEAKKKSKAFATQIEDAAKYAQSASYAKGVVGYTAYNGSILRWGQKKIDDLNSKFGLRMYSFTDYHPAFVLENMQMVTDAAVKGLKVLAYTKEIDFARIFMPTGMNINISISAQMKMVNGEYVQDGMMGADWEEAKKVRTLSNKYGGNVGITFVGFNDAQVEWACAQDWIDVVIPFHTVKAEDFVSLHGWTNYKGLQEDTKWSDWDEAKTNDPSIVSEVNPPEHHNDFDTYVAACERNHLNPRFKNWFDKWGGDKATQKMYMKLVNETRRSYADTDSVQPVFDMAAVADSIKSLKLPYGAKVGQTQEGYEDITLDEIADSIAEGIDKQGFSDTRFSRELDAQYMDAVNSGDMETAQRMVDEAAKAAGWRQEHMFHGSLAYGFNVFDKAKAHVGGNSGAGFYFSSSEDDSDSHYADIEGADNFFKAQSLAERIVDAGEWDGIEVTDYDKALEIAKKELDKTPGTYNVYLRYDNPFIRDFGNSTNLYDAIMDDFDESTVDRDDYENDEAYEEDLNYYQWDHFTETLYSAIRGAYSDIEDMYDVEFGPYLSDLVDRISGKAIDYQSLGWKDLVDAIEEENGIMVFRDDWDTDADASSEFARAIIENLGFDAIVDYEVSKKFGQLSREMMDDTYHTIVFKPNQIKSAGPITLDDNGNVIPLSERFNTENQDIRYSMELDSEGRELSEGQQEYFKESKVRDAEGNLLTVYHGSPTTDITVFDRGRAGEHTGAYSDRAIWFTANKKFADDFSYEFKPTDSMFYVERGAKGRVYPGYLNIVNPFDLTNPTQEMKEILYRGASEIYKDPETKINELLEIGNHQLLKKYLDFDELEAAGYDGIIAKLDVKGSDLEYGIFNSNQAKDVNNLNPTDDQDIRYSIETKNFAKKGNLQTYNVQRNRAEKPTDSIAPATTKDTEDRTLSKGQKEFFKNSKMRDENGNLIVMYHGTERAGFTIFDPEYSADGIKGMFFTDSLTTAKSYSGRRDIYNLSRPSLKELNEALEESGLDNRVVKTKDGYELQENGYIEETFKTFREAEQYVRENYRDAFVELGENRINQSANYAVYLNITNPLIVDAEGNNFDDINGESTVEIAQRAYTEGYDGVIIRNVVDNALNASGAERFNSSTVAIIFDSNQVKSVDNLNPTEDEDIRYSQELGLVREGNTARWTDERIDHLIAEYGASNKDYSQAYAALMNPRDYLKLTLSDEMLDKWNEGSNDPNHPETYSLDEEQLRENTQTPFLSIYSNDGPEVQGHEGRHRMRALLEAGINSVPVVIRDTDTKYTKTSMESMTLTAQDFGNGPVNNNAHVTITDLVPIKETNREELVQKFGGNADVRFSRELEPNAQITFPDDLQSQLDALAELREQYDALQKENKKNARRAEYFKGETKLNVYSKNPQLDTRKIDRAAKALVKDYGLQMELPELKRKLLKYAEDFHFGGKDFHDLAMDILPLANEIVRTAKVIVDSPETEILDRIKKTKIKVSEKIRSDIPDYGSFRKEYFGIAQMSTLNGTPVEDFYRELQDAYGMSLFPDEVKNPTDQLYTILETASTLQPKAVSPFGSYELSNATQSVALDIMNDVMSMTPHKTFADKQVEARQKLKKKMQAQADKAIQKVRDNRDERIKKLKEHNSKVRKNAIERRKATVLRNKIKQHVSDLSNYLLKPTDKRHIPQNLQPTVAKLLESINLESTYRDDKGNVYTGKATKRTAAFRELQTIYAEMAKGGHMVIDPDLMGDDLTTGLFAEIIAMNNTSIMAMNSEQLSKIWRAVRAMENAVRTANKLFAQSRYQNVSQIATAMHDDNVDKTKGNLNFGKIQKLVSLDMLTPEAYFHRLGDAGDYLFKEMRKAQDEAITIYNEAVKYGEENLKGADFRKLEKEMHQVKLGGRQIKLSTAQLMELYLLMGRTQAREHILSPSGGLKLRDVKKGAKIERHPDPIKNITAKEISDAMVFLSPQQIAWAESMQKYVSGPLADHGNKASMQVYGYEKFTDDNYWKITSNEQDVRRDIGRTKGVITSVSGKGMAQPLTPKANTSIMLGSIFDTYSNSVMEMADYAAWLATMEDVNRIRNYQAYEGEKENRHRAWTMQQTFDRVFGDGGAKYLETLMSHLANGVQSEQTFFGGFTGNYKAAVIGFNIRVVIQQPTAIFRAMDMISPKYLLSAMASRSLKGWKEAKKYSPIAVWKDWGFFDIGTGRQMKGILFKDSNALEKVKAAGMWLPGQADSVGWGWLWNAVKKEVKATTDLEGEAYYKRVAKRFNDIVDHTQVVDGVLQRPDIMRRSDALTKMAVSFMAEPMKQYNMMLSAVYDSRHATGAKRTAAKKRIARAAGTLLIAGIINAVAQSIVDGLRNTDRDKDYWEKFLAALLGDYDEDKKDKSKFEEAITSNLGDMLNVAGYIPFAKDILSLLEGYDVSRMDMDAMSDSIKSAQAIVKASKGEGKDSLGMAIVNACGSFGQLLGISFKNIKREALAVTSAIVHGTGSYVAEYHLLAAQKNINSTTKKEFMDLLIEAHEKDKDAYKYLYNEYIKNKGFATSKLSSQEYVNSKIDEVEKAQKTEKSRSKVGLTTDDINKYEAALKANDKDKNGTPSKEEIYNALMSIDLTMKQKNELWNEKGFKKDGSPQKLSDYGEIVKEKQAVADRRTAAGLTDKDIKAYESALKKHDSDNNGSISKEEVYQTLMDINLSTQQKEVLWAEKGYKQDKKPQTMSQYREQRAKQKK